MATWEEGYPSLGYPQNGYVRVGFFEDTWLKGKPKGNRPMFGVATLTHQVTEEWEGTKSVDVCFKLRPKPKLTERLTCQGTTLGVVPSRNFEDL